MRSAGFGPACGLLGAALLGIAAAAAKSGGPTDAVPIKTAMPWYHTGEEVHQKLQELAQQCPGATFSLSSRSASPNGQEVTLDVLHVGRPNNARKTKAMIIFGEHARELITVESGLDFVRTLCGDGDKAERAGHVLDNTDFVILPNANPISRAKVEKGYACKRTNEDGVDLNRNWGDEHRDVNEAGKDSEMNPGPNGFSEPETQIMRDLVNEERPDIFLSVHSGAYLLGTPFGYTGDREAKNEPAMLEVLGPISEKYCNGRCPFGSLQKMISYKSMGCDIDYASEQGVPYVFEWEIYVDPTTREFYAQKAKSNAGGGEMGEDAQTFFWGQGTNLLQSGASVRRSLRGTAASGSRASGRAGMRLQRMAGAPEMAEDPQGCTAQFNPQSETETKNVIDNWTGAYLALAEAVNAKRGSGAAPSATPPTADAAAPPTADAAAADLPDQNPFADPFSSSAAPPSVPQAGGAAQGQPDVQAEAPADPQATYAALWKPKLGGSATKDEPDADATSLGEERAEISGKLLGDAARAQAADSSVGGRVASWLSSGTSVYGSSSTDAVSPW